ncbi:hypothetical protein [Priestia megaterium]|uniref:hypothetical protein n=1 Tax=Priestia megaterium TaxID=1404 RepID=UPI003009A51B
MSERIEENENTDYQSGYITYLEKVVFAQSDQVSKLQKELEEAQRLAEERLLSEQDWEDEYHAMKRRYEELDSASLETSELYGECAKDLIATRKELEEAQRQAAEWETTARTEYKIHNEVQDKLAEAQRQATVKNEELVTAYDALEKLQEEFNQLDKGAADDFQKLIEAQQTITKLHEIVEEGRNALNSIIEGEWEETMDEQFLEVWTTRRINPPAIADEALFCMARQLEELGE